MCVGKFAFLPGLTVMVVVVVAVVRKNLVTVDRDAHSGESGMFHHR